MKKVLTIAIIFFTIAMNGFTQACISVDINDDVYNLLETAQARGLCSFLIGTKPYTRQRILRALNEILDNGAPIQNIFDEEGVNKESVKEFVKKSFNRKAGKGPRGKLSQREVEVVRYYIERFTPKTQSHLGLVYTRAQNKSVKVPLSFEYNFMGETNLSAGLYSKSDFNAFAFDFIAHFDFSGDISKYFSYNLHGVLDISRVPLYERGDDYFIGYSWFDDFTTKNGTHAADENKNYDLSDFADSIDSDGFDAAVSKYDEPRRRILRKQSNTAYLPFTYLRKFGGQVYYLENLSTSGLEGWPTTTAITFAITADMRTSLLDDKINIGVGRVRHEWAAMDRGSSLVLNSNALPFFACDMSFDILPFLKFSNLTGILEYPNQDYIADKSWPDNKEDDSLFQNAFSINMLELDWRYFHFDFGSSVVWPKRWELGYLFPLINYVVYQNHLGDNDNCALFADIKFRKDNIGSIWGSIYLDEINGLNNDPITSARAMFAGQLGVKVVIPPLPFTSVSFRYTKVEPFCYTHHSINYTPWYDHYICENYTSGGEPLGYYLPPNADEFLLRFESMPQYGVTCNLQYQFIRHGADYGSQQVQGSSYYSELTPQNRDSVEKHFLHDGAYNWMHIISVGASYANKSNPKCPFQIYGTVGFMYSYYTMIDDDDYEMTILGNKKADKNTKYHWVDNNEYPVQCGAVISVGVKLWQF